MKQMMEDDLTRILELAREAKMTLMISGTHTRSFEDKIDINKKIAFDFLTDVEVQAKTGELNPEIELKMNEVEKSLHSLPPPQKAPAFVCVSNYKSCKSEAESLEEKVLCCIALTICLAKEVIPLA